MNDNLINIISFNLKRDSPFTLRNTRKWQTRRELAAKIIRDNGAVVVGVQELMPKMREDIWRLLDNKYSILGVGRLHRKNLNDDEHSDIIIKNDETEVRFINTFWLSKHPERISRAYYAFFPRICTVAEVYIKKLDHTVRVFNTHLDHICSFARFLGVRVILDYMSEYNNKSKMPTILMGDFNCSFRSKPIMLLRAQVAELYPELQLKDVFSACDQHVLSNTLHNFSGKVKLGASPIDYIFVSDEFEVVDSRVLTEPVEGSYPSDHFPLLATLKLKPQNA